MEVDPNVISSGRQEMATPVHADNSEAFSLDLLGLAQEAELLTEAIVDTVREPLLILDHKFCIRFANRSFYLAFKVVPEKTLGRLVYEVGNAQWNIPRLRHLLDEILPRNSSFVDFEVMLELPKIGRKTIVLNGRKLRRREDQTDLILLTIEDVTALREAQERDALAATVLRCSGEALVGLSSEGTIRSWNPAAERLFGYTSEEAIGSAISILDPPAVEGEQNDVIARLRAGETVAIETVRVAKNGRSVSVILNAAPVLDSLSNVVGISAALTDITERKKMEQQLLTLVKEKETLVQETHHRVKNNLQMIVSLLGFHAEQANDPRVMEALSEAGGRVQAIARLHQALYKSENLTEIDFGEYIEQLTNELRDLHSRAEITVQVFTEDIVLGMDAAIPFGLIANELILNCFKHAFPSGRAGTLTVSVESVRDGVAPGESLDDALIRLRVQDDGIGLPSGYEVEKAESMGMRLVQLLVRQLHAQLEVQSLNGLTSTVTVRSVTPRSIAKVSPEI